MEPSSPIVGRESELEFLMDRMSSALSGQGGLVLVSGEAGSGKTTLCETFEQLAAESGCLIMVGRCIPGPPTPYMPFMEAFLGQPSDPFAAGSLDEGGGLLLSALALIERLLERRPVVLRVEDLHWSDSASIAMLHFLARNVRGRRVLLVGTYRPEDLHPSPAGEPHPLNETLPIMRREGLCHELEVKLLDPHDTMSMVPLLLGGPADERLLGLVADESRGNPLFAVEMVRYLLGSEQVTCDRGTWKLRLRRKVPTPSTVREVILARIEHLPKGARTILEAAAVVGERFEPELIEGAQGIERVQLGDTLELLDREYRLVQVGEGRCWFSHQTVRQVVYEGISRARRKELHRRIGLLLEQRLPSDDLFGLLSMHFLAAGENEKCIRYSMAAGRLCRRRKAAREAKAFFLTVLQQAGEEDGLIADQLEALESLGDLKNDASSPREWFSYYERFLGLSRDLKAKARVLAKAAECWDSVGLGDPRRAYELLDEAETVAEDDPLALAEIAYRRADLSSNEGKAEVALAQIALARRLFESLEDPVGTSKCRELEIVILRQALRFREARRLAEAQLQAVRAIEDPEPLLRVEMLDAFICALTGDTVAAKRYASEVIELASKLGMMWTYRLALHYRAYALEMEGDVEGARADVSKALENAREYESPFHVAMCEIDLGICESELGLLESAEDHYEEALRMAASFEPYPRSLLETDLSVLKAELLWRTGRFRESDEVYSWTIICAQESGQPYEMMSCYTRYAMSLALRDMDEVARPLFEEALEMSTSLGCERKVRALAQRVGISI